MRSAVKMAAKAPGPISASTACTTSSSLKTTPGTPRVCVHGHRYYNVYSRGIFSLLSKFILKTVEAYSTFSLNSMAL